MNTTTATEDSSVQIPSLQDILEAALLVAAKPLSISQLQKLFLPNEKPNSDTVRAILNDIQTKFQTGGIRLKKTASGWQLQSSPELGEYMSRLHNEKPPRYSRALLETLALIAWRQPITRAEIEDIRGVAINSNIIKTLLDREWIKVIGQRDIPGKPEILGTTKEFLDYFNLNSLKDLPALKTLLEPKETKNLEEDKIKEIQKQLVLKSQQDTVLEDNQKKANIITVNTNKDKITEVTTDNNEKIIK